GLGRVRRGLCLLQRGVCGVGYVVAGVLEYVVVAIVGRGQLFGLRQLREGADGVDAAVEVVQRGRTQLGHGVEVLRRHALVGVVAAQAVEDEVMHLGAIGRRGRAVLLPRR